MGGLGFRVQDLGGGLGVWGVWRCRVQDLGFGVEGLTLGFKVWRFRGVRGFRFRVWGYGAYRV